MTIYLYRWKIKSGKEKQFEESWAEVTKAILVECGSLGSRLHLDENGEYFAYAQWPSKTSRESCKLSDATLEARRAMRDATEYSYPDQCLEVLSDFLISGKK